MNYQIRVSVYPALTKEALALAKTQAKRYGVEIHFSNEFESFLKMFNNNTNKGQEVWNICPWKRCWTLHEGIFFNCPQAAFLPGQFPKKFPDITDPLVDGVPVDGITSEKIQWMMDHAEPLESCANCTGGTNARIQWSQERDRVKWTEKSTV